MAVKPYRWILEVSGTAGRSKSFVGRTRSLAAAVALVRWLCRLSRSNGWEFWLYPYAEGVWDAVERQVAVDLGVPVRRGWVAESGRVWVVRV